MWLANQRQSVGCELRPAYFLIQIHRYRNYG